MDADRCGALRRAAIFVAMAGVAGCGGGEDEFGTPPGVVSSFDGPLTAAAFPVDVAPVFSSVRFDGVADDPRVSGFFGPDPFFVITIDPAAGTITISPDTVRAIDFDDDSVAYDKIATGFATVSFAEVLIPGAASGYIYSSHGNYGTTSTFCLFGTCGSSFHAASFFFGSPADGVPTGGDATFSGRMIGHHSPYSQAAYDLDGVVTLFVDFRDRKVTGSFHDIAILRQLGPDLASFPDIQVDASVSGNRIAGGVSDGSGGAGDLTGGLFGPGAPEMAGVFFLTGNGFTSGSFAAKQ